MPLVRRAVGQRTHDVLRHLECRDGLEERRVHRLAHRLAHLLEGEIPRSRVRMPRRVGIELHVVLDRHLACVRRELVRQILVERHGIERVADVDPPPHVRRDDEPPHAGEIADVVLHLRDAERGADRHEQRDVEILELGLHQHAVRDHRPLAVRDDDERSAAGAQPLAKRLEHHVALRLVDEQIVHVAQEHLASRSASATAASAAAGSRRSSPARRTRRSAAPGCGAGARPSSPRRSTMSRPNFSSSGRLLSPSILLAMTRHALGRPSSRVAAVVADAGELLDVGVRCCPAPPSDPTARAPPCGVSSPVRRVLRPVGVVAAEADSLSGTG